MPIAEALAQASAGLVDDPQAAAFAETGVRVAALAGDEQSAWAWVDAGGERVQSWQLLLAATDPQGPRAEAALAEGVTLALQGGLPPPVLHRLVTVLDALSYDVPIPLWDEASKTPQPNDGDLPATGALTSLKQAADAGEVGRTVLIAAAVLGRNGAKGAHIIALGDTLRALKRVGLDAEARRLGFEALYAHWPSPERPEPWPPPNDRAMTDTSELALFLDMLTAERGAAAHTIEAYTRDLSEFLAFLAGKGKNANDRLARSSPRLSRRACAQGPGAHLARAKALGHPPVLPLSPRRGHARR